MAKGMEMGMGMDGARTLSFSLVDDMFRSRAPAARSGPAEFNFALPRHTNARMQNALWTPVTGRYRGWLQLLDSLTIARYSALSSNANGAQSLRGGMSMAVWTRVGEEHDEQENDDGNEEQEE